MKNSIKMEPSTSAVSFITEIFENSDKVIDLLCKGYKIVVLGNDLALFTGSRFIVNTINHIRFGLEPSRLYFIFIKPSTNNRIKPWYKDLQTVDADLNECSEEYADSFPHGWRKIRENTKYPFECYIYMVEHNVECTAQVHINSTMVSNIISGQTIRNCTLHNDRVVVVPSLLSQDYKNHERTIDLRVLTESQTAYIVTKIAW